MYPATPQDRNHVIHIIEESFRENNSVSWVVKNDHKQQQRLRSLAAYMFDKGILKKGVFLSSDREALAICYRNKEKMNVFSSVYLQLKLLFQAIGVSNVFKVLKRQHHLASKKPNTDYLYFWVFAASDKGKGNGGAKELQEGIYELSAKQNLPIYLETSIPKNKIVYERYGFQTYDTWRLQDHEFDMWFMKREPV